MTVPAATLPRAVLRRHVLSPVGLTVALAAIAGVALRVWVYRSVLGRPDSDEAEVGLMTLHILHGVIPTFLWGQAYGGSQEALLTAPLFLVFGSSWLLLRLVPLLLFALTVVLVWRIGRRTIGERGSIIAAAIFMVWPGFVVYKLTHQWDFYASDVVYCSLLILLGLRIVERPDRARVGLFGLVLGLAFWQTSQIVPVAAAVIVWTAWKRPASLRQLWIAVPTAALGALPWIAWNARHGWASLSLTGGGGTYADRVRLFFSPDLPMMLGLRVPGTQALLLPHVLTDLIYAGAAALFLFGAYRARAHNRSLLYFAAAVYPFVFGLSAQTWNAGDPRFLVPLAPVLVLLVAEAVTRWRAGGLVALFLACVLSAVTLHRMASAPRQLDDFGALIATLNRLDLHRVYASYWIAYELDFDSHERTIAVENKFDHVTFSANRAVLADDPVVHYAPYQRLVARGRHGFVFFASEVAARPIVPELVRHGFRRVGVSTFVVFVPPGAG